MFQNVYYAFNKNNMLFTSKFQKIQNYIKLRDIIAMVLNQKAYKSMLF